MNAKQRRVEVRSILKAFRDLSDTERERELAKAASDVFRLGREVTQLRDQLAAARADVARGAP